MSFEQFEVLELGVNEAVFRHLSNASAQIQIAAEPIRVIFEVPFSDPYGPVMDGVQPHMLALDSQVVGLENGHTATVNGLTYRVERMEPDGVGITRVVLRDALA